jgi:hypothetical protein
MFFTRISLTVLVCFVFVFSAHGGEVGEEREGGATPDEWSGARGGSAAESHAARGAEGGEAVAQTTKISQRGTELSSFLVWAPHTHHTHTRGEE